LFLVAAAVVLVAAALRNAFRRHRWYGVAYRGFYLAQLPVWAALSTPWQAAFEQAWTAYRVGRGQRTWVLSS
jgi:hypothetical protein